MARHAPLVPTPAQIPAVLTPSLLTHPTAALAAALCDRCVLERPLGHGGMVTVYLARDLKHDHPVALKDAWDLRSAFPVIARP
jgi:hypothetical protein